MRITIDVTPGSARRLAIVGATLLVLGVAAVSHAVPVPIPDSFTTGLPLTAKQLTSNFDAVEIRLAALEAAKPVSTRNGKRYTVGATYCGKSAATTGGITSGQLTGYAAAKAQCEAVCGTDTAHLCGGDELTHSNAVGLAPPVGWYSSPVPLVLQGEIYHDCTGFTSGDLTYGSVWAGPYPSLIQRCNSSNPLLCCD